MPLLTPKDAAPVMNISRATITRCVQNGAPVHRRGAAGRKYLIDPAEFIQWMEKQVYKPMKSKQINAYTEKAAEFKYAAMAKERRQRVLEGKEL